MQLRFLNILWRRLRLVTGTFDHKSLVLLVVQLRVVFGWRWKGLVEPLQRKGAHVLRQEVFACMPPGASCPSMLHLPPTLLVVPVERTTIPPVTTDHDGEFLPVEGVDQPPLQF